MFKKPVRTLIAAALVVAAGTAGAQQQSINLYNWSDYIPPELLKKFEEETGIRVNLDVYDSNETLLARLKAGATGYDVIVPSDYMVQIMINENLLQKIDVAAMPNFANVMAPLDKPDFDPARAYSAPYMWGVTGFSYDSARVPGGQLDESWASFFQPPAELRGQVVALNDVNDLFTAAAIHLGIDQCTTDGREGQRILELLEAQKPFLAMYNSDGTIERMAAGEVIMHHQWNGAAWRARQERDTIRYVIPREGVPFWSDHFAVPVGARNVEGAKTFINWMMAPENIALASNFTGYNNGIRGADRFMDAGLAQDPGVNPPEELRDRFVPNKVCPQAALDLRDRIWTRLKR